MILAMQCFVLAGLLWIAFALFRQAGIGDVVDRLPAFLVLSLVWIIFVMFGGLLLEAFTETVAT